VLGVILALVLAVPVCSEKVERLKPQGYVNDFAGVLGEASKAQLTALCAEADQKAEAQLAVVTVRSLEGVPVEDFSMALATRWGIGPKKSSRGVLILLAVEDRKYRVEVGYGLEPILPDGRVGSFAREMAPLLRQGNYGGALLHLTARIAGVIAQDRGVTLSSIPRKQPLAPAERAPFRPTASLVRVLFPLIAPFSLLFLVRLFAAFQGRGGVQRRRYGSRWRMWPGGWYSGGSWGGGGFGSGGGGFGGFGGGSFGGGGASGSW